MDSHVVFVVFGLLALGVHCATLTNNFVSDDKQGNALLRRETIVDPHDDTEDTVGSSDQHLSPEIQTIFGRAKQNVMTAIPDNVLQHCQKHFDGLQIEILAAGIDRAASLQVNAELPGKPRLMFGMFTKDDDMVMMVKNLVCSVNTLARTQKAQFVFLLVAVDVSCNIIADVLDNSRMVCVSLATKVAPPGAETNVQYQDPRYLFMVEQKLLLLHASSALAANFEWVLYVDADIVVNSDPFAFLDEREHSGLNTSFYFMYNERYMRSMGNCKRLPNNRWVNSGFFYARPTPSVNNVFEAAIADLQAGRSYDGGDQGAITTSLGNSGVRWEFLPCFQFVNGRNYFKHPDETRDAIALHLNWISSSKVKLDCFRHSGNWHLRPDDSTCSVSATTAAQRPNAQVSWSPGGVVRKCEAS